MATHFQNDLEVLKKTVIQMGAAVERNIRQATAALIDRNAEMVNQVIDGDAAIDQLELDIDQQCHHMLALHHPVADDLRFILACTKVNNELERMGDHAKRIAKAAAALSRHPALPIYDHLGTMANQVNTMVAGCLDAFVLCDDKLAQTIWDADDIVDKAFAELMEEATEAMVGKPDMVEAGLRVVSAARDLERVGDIATNIAKDVIFLVRGQNVAHRYLQSGSGTASTDSSPPATPS